MAKKKYAHLVKTLLVQKPPAGLYPEPWIWMEGKDMEGFNANFSYGFVKKPGKLHPMEGALVHPYDECLVFAGTDNTDITYLGAEVSVALGEEAEEHVFNVPSVIIVPKGTPHGPVTVGKIERPIVHYSIGLAADYKAESLPEKAKTKGSKYGRLVKPLGPGFEPVRMSIIAKDERLLAEFKKEHPDFQMDMSQVGLLGPGNADQLVWLYGNDLEGFEVNFTWGFYTGSGIWHRGGEAHYHPSEEILVFIGLDPDDLNFLGCEQELALGKEYERHVFNKPTVAVCPSGFPHLPLITRWTDKPYGFIVCCLSGEHDSPWVQEEE
ncbi:MAG TPA: hypothetical protein G4N91_02515 [Dehalococcoidia bacterium]|nr:hypothetical protein [Dehalococcoidia bacterium]